MSIKIITLVAAVVMISCNDSSSRSKTSKRRNAGSSVSIFSNDSEGQSFFEIVEDEYGGADKNLGERELGESLSITYLLRNNGSKNLLIERVEPDCSCTVGTFTKDPIPPGETGSIDLIYNVVMVNTPFEKKATVYTNQENGEFEISFKGYNGKAEDEDFPFDDEESSLDFPDDAKEKIQSTYESPVAVVDIDTLAFDSSPDDGLMRIADDYDTALQNMKSFIDAYYTALANRGDFQAYRWFAAEVDQWIKMKDITPRDINEIWNNESKDDFVNQRFNVWSHTIAFDRAEGDINYYTFDVDFSCYRPSKRKRQTCNILIEMGVNADQKLVSYIEKKVTNLKYFDEY